MGKVSLSNIDFLQVKDQKNSIFYGCHQEWYGDQWQRKAGCGPSVACNIISYLDATKKLFGDTKQIGKMDDCLTLMNEVWNYVTPSERGIPVTSKFYDSFLFYSAKRGVNLELRCLDIPEALERPPFSDVVAFIKEGLLHDVPIAFLNLCNGKEEELDGWHWVTLVEIDDTGGKHMIRIVDEGIIKTIDLFLWYETTTLGGGFVYFLAD